MPSHTLRSRLAGDSIATVVAFALTCVVLLLGVWLIDRNTHRLAGANGEVDRTHRVVTGLERLLSTLKDAETGQRGFVITGNPDFLQPHDEALGRVWGEFEEVLRLTSDNPTQQDRLALLRQRIVSKLAESKVVIDLRREDAEAARAAVGTGRGKAEMDAVRKAVAEMQVEERRLMAERGGRTAGVVRQSAAVTALTGAVGLLTICVAFYHDRRRRGAAEALAEQGERLRTTLASIGDAVISTDTEGRVTAMNAVAETLTGWANAEAAGRPLDAVFRIVNETSRLPVENPAIRALTEGVIVGLANHTVLVAKDGTERPIDDSAAPIRCKAGELVGCVLVFRDISERHRQEAELRDSERQFRTLAESIPQLTWMANPDGHIFWYNRRWYDYTGTTLEQMAGWGWQSVHDPDELPKVMDRWQASIASREPFDMVFPLRGGDGVFRPFLTRVEPVTDGGGRVVRWFGTNTDITEHREAERELRRRETFIGGVLGSITDGFYAVDRDWRFTFVNDEIARRSGRPRGEIVGGHVWEMFPAAVGNEAYVQLHRAMADRVAVEYEMYYEPWGRWLSDKAFPTDDGGLAVYSRDVTERERADQWLRASEARYHTLFESMDEGYCVTEVAFDDAGGAADYRFLEVNPAFEKHTGLSGAAGRTMRELVPDLEAHWFETYGRVARTGEPVRFVDEAKAMGGRWFDVYAFRLGGAGSNKVAVLFTDITARRHAEGRLGESEERLRLVVESATGFAIFTMDGGGVVTGWNSGAERLFGYPDAEIVGKHDRILYTPEDAAQRIPEREIVKAAEEGRAVNERWHVRRDGSQFWGSGLVQPLRSEGGAVVGFLKIMRDMTEARRWQETLERQAAELKDADRRKDVFLATLAHELRNPLAPIRNGLQVIRMAGADATVEQARSMMDRQLTQLVRLVDDLLDISRVTQGKLELRRGRVEVRAVIDAAVETSRPLIEQAGHELAVAVPDEPIFVDGDVTRLAQVVSNLLNNSAKYTHRGGHIRLGVRREGEAVAVSVADDGIGIPPAMLDKVFAMFTQVDRTLERTTGGLGIGLSLVKGLVEMHGGTVEARSEGEGKGSEFVVRLPVAVPAAGVPGDAGGEAEVVPASGRRRLLVVDDNADAADSMAQLLELMGNEVETANDGEAGVAAAGAFRPDVVLMDIGMPKLNGHEAARRIRDQSWGTNMVLVALTGWGQDDDRQKSADAGFDHHLVKPVEFAALTKLLAGLTVGQV